VSSVRFSRVLVDSVGIFAVIPFRFFRVRVVSVRVVPFALCVILDSSFLSLYHLVPVLIFPPLEILRRRLDLVSIVSIRFAS